MPRLLWNILPASPPFETVARGHVINRMVFLAPPWPEIFATDAERQHGFEAAVAEYDRLRTAYATLGHELVILPKVSVKERVDFCAGEADVDRM